MPANMHGSNEHIGYYNCIGCTSSSCIYTYIYIPFLSLPDNFYNN